MAVKSWSSTPRATPRSQSTVRCPSSRPRASTPESLHSAATVSPLREARSGSPFAVSRSTRRWPERNPHADQLFQVMVERVFVSGFAIGIDMAVGGVGSTNRLDVEDAIVRGNGNGVEVAGQNEVRLDRVRVAENTEWGVWVATGASAHIRDSVIERNGNFGVVIDSFGTASGAMLLTIERSTVRGSAVTAGIKLFSRLSAADIRASVSNSVVSQNSTGIEATCQDASLAAATVSDSTVSNNSSEGIVASGASCAVAASHNVISGNGGASAGDAGGRCL